MGLVIVVFFDLGLLVVVFSDLDLLVVVFSDLGQNHQQMVRSKRRIVVPTDQQPPDCTISSRIFLMTLAATVFPPSPMAIGEPHPGCTSHHPHLHSIPGVLTSGLPELTRLSTSPMSNSLGIITLQGLLCYLFGYGANGAEPIPNLYFRMWGFGDYEGYESDPVDEVLLAEREAIMAEHIPDLIEDGTLDPADLGYPELPTPPLPGLGDEGHQNDPVDEAFLAVREAIMAEHFALYSNDGRLEPAEVGNSERPTPADAVSSRPLVPLSTIYQRSDPAGFGSGSEALLAEREVIMFERAELPVHQGDPGVFGSENEDPLDEIAPIIAKNLVELLDDLNLGPPEVGNSERPTPADAISTRPLFPLSTINQQLDISHVDVSDLGNEDVRGDAELPQYDGYTDEGDCLDIHLGLNESEGDENASACFPCPFCYVDIEVQVLCRHLQDEHCFDLKDAVCPLCAASLGKDVTGHFIAQHSSLLKNSCGSSSEERGQKAAFVQELVQSTIFIYLCCWRCSKFDTELQVAYAEQLGVPLAQDTDCYLGLPSIILKFKMITFSFIEEQIARRLRCWKRDCLSPAGTHTLLRSVISGLPVYAMSCFHLPDEMCNRLSQLMADYWWGQVGDRRRLHWVTWQFLCLPQSEGGLGFRDFKLFNQTLLANHCWRLLENPASLLAQLLKARYHPLDHFLCATAGSRPSWGWQSLMYGCSLLLQGLRRQVGDGSTTRILRDSWLPGSEPGPPVFCSATYSGPKFVSDLHVNGRWRLELLQTLFTPASVRLIQSIPLPLSPSPDCWIWHFSVNGIFSTSSAFRFSQHRPLASESNDSVSPLDSLLWHSVWSLPVLPKLGFFLWRILLRILPIHQSLIEHHLNVDPVCP
ncbi:Uncharacterized mitochondrial protein AtMg00310, partial [Linum grandiflorum]